MQKIILSLFIMFTLQSCFYFHTEVNELAPDNLSKSGKYSIKSPVKVHLNDGQLIVYEDGFNLENDTLYGAGLFYNVLRDSSYSISKYPFDETAYYEYYSNVFEPETMVMTAPVAFIGASILLIAIFGSCPTVYSYTDSTAALEAECFSYSVSEMFEQPDLDKLNFSQPADNKLKINLRNEALETHYIDKFNLLVVDHDKNYSAYPTDEEEILLVGDFLSVFKATDKSGNSIFEKISQKDSIAYRTDEKLVEELQHNITTDWIDIETDVPKNADEVALVITYRNTLLNTILLYDVMLGSQGAEAIDWIGDKTDNLWYAYNFDKWYRSNFGIHIKVFDGDEYEEVYRLGDTGPIVEHESVVKLDVPSGEKLKLRLEFLPDNFFIDQIGISFDISEDFDSHEIKIHELYDIKNQNKISGNLMEKDDNNYFITYPYDNYDLTFELPPFKKNKTRSYFISSEGYYIEWIRKNWIEYGASLPRRKQFEFGEDAIKNTAELWLKKKNEFEKHFHETKLK